MGYSAAIHEQADKKLEHRRLYAEQELQKRRDSLYARCPRAESIERTIAKTSVAAAKAVFGGADIRQELQSLKQRNLGLQSELAGLLEEMKLPANYLEPWYTCPDCRDTGYQDGKMCPCLKKLLRDIAYDDLNKISPLSLCDFDSFSLEYYSKTPPTEGRSSPFTQMTNVLGFCKKYARTFSEYSHSLLFQGAPGLGKTHLSLAIAREVIALGYGVVYVSAPAILSRIESEHFDNRRPEPSAEEIVTACDLLIIDDLGTEFNSRFSVSALYNVINTRMIMARPTIISTNLSLSELQDKYNSRIISRIIGTLDRVEFTGTDIRQQKRRQEAQKNRKPNK